MMIDCNYPDREHHAKLHGYLLAEADNKIHELLAGTIRPNDVFQFLFERFALHTIGEDKKLVGYINSNPPIT